VDSIGYMHLCMSENIMVERAHFQKIFEVMAKREQTAKQMPLQLQEAIKQIQLKSMDEPLKIGGAVND
jgi:hypothetical protein